MSASRSEESDDNARLRELESRIFYLTRMLPDLESINSSREAKMLREIILAKEEKEMILERTRVSEVVAAFEAENPQKKYECEACGKALVMPSYHGLIDKSLMQDEDHDYSQDTTIRVGFSLTHCCGQTVCMECFAQFASECCPSCGEAFPLGDGEMDSKIRSLAEADNAWAQFHLACNLTGLMEAACDETAKKNYKDEAVDLLRQAVSQGLAVAASMMAFEYTNDLSQDLEEYRRWLELGAHLGDADCQGILGCMLDEDKEGKDETEAVKWYTLAVSKGGNQLCALNLADHFQKGTGGLDVSLVRAKHYLEHRARDGNERAQYKLSEVLFLHGQDHMSVPGCSTIPRTMYWARRSLESGSETDASQVIQATKKIFVHFCANCGERGQSLRCCSRCKVFCFCSKECQRTYWKDGHKFDCVSATDA